MAEVYKAYQPSLDRYVAVKVLHPFLLEEAGSRERFQREARAVATLRHPNIVQVFDFDDAGRHLLHGHGVHRRAQPEGQFAGSGPPGHPPEPGARGEIVTAIGGALAYAHRQGMIHRDVKPHNIMFTAGASRC